MFKNSKIGKYTVSTPKLLYASLLELIIEERCIALSDHSGKRNC